MKYFNWEKYKQQLDDGKKVHSKPLMSSMFFLTLYPMIFLSGSLELIATATLMCFGCFVFKYARRIFLHNIKLVMAVASLYAASGYCFYLAHEKYNRDLSFPGFSAIEPLEFSAYAMVVIIFGLLVYSVASSEYTIDDEA